MTLDRVRKFALSLPGTTEEPHFDKTSFRVRGKIFATAPPDGKVLHIFVGDAQRADALAHYPVFLENLFWGRQIAGLRAQLPHAQPKVIDNLLALAWMRKAPKRLLAEGPQT